MEATLVPIALFAIVLLGLLHSMSHPETALATGLSL